MALKGAATLFSCPDGAGGENRTPTPVKEPDFESGASTSSATPASGRAFYNRRARQSTQQVESAAMLRSDFAYTLPPELIAKRPLAQRSAARMLCLDGASGQFDDQLVADLPGLLRPDDLVVVNDARVWHARLHGHKATGGKVEVLVERLETDDVALAHVRTSKSLRAGACVSFPGGRHAEFLGREGDLFRLRLDGGWAELMAEHGHVPLPPYIDREDDADDASRYQTVFAQREGAVAAPTAGLHFDAALRERVVQACRGIAAVTLWVGAGTFQPVRAERVEDHVMHHERIEVSEQLVNQIEAARDAGGRVVAIGTTVVRALESAAIDGQLKPFAGETDLFLTPGAKFHVVDAMLTNFHLPESTLLMLVSAFAGQKATLAAYQHAIGQRYRFFSYGDAMFVTPAAGVRKQETGT